MTITEVATTTPTLYSALAAKFTGDIKFHLRTFGIGNEDMDVDFEWVAGNEYILVTNVFLEDADPQWITLKDSVLTLNGYKHIYVLEFVADYPEIDLKVFRRLVEIVKSNVAW